VSWREELDSRPASFRGVPFQVRSHDIRGGRRTRSLEFPLRDKPATEDMGRKAHRFRVEAFVLGEDYMDARNALLDALDAYGDGVLVHPYYGSRTVAVQEWHVREMTRRGGMAVVSIEFVEGGPVELPDDAEDTGWAVEKAAEELTEAATATFTETVDTSGPERNRESLLDRIDNALDELSDAVNEACGPIYKLTDPLTRIIAMKTKVEALLELPITLARQLSGLFDGLFSFDLPNYRLLLSLFTSSSAWPSGSSSYSSSPKSVLSTVGATIETNATAVTGLLRASLVAEAATSASGTDFATYDDAVAVRTALLDALDHEAATADDTVYLALASLRTAVVKDFAARESLPRLTSYTPGETLPALVVSHAIYGNAGRADEIVARNKVRHPGAVPGGTTLKVVTDG
jgi:prophage DNA circulation protein